MRSGHARPGGGTPALRGPPRRAAYPLSRARSSDPAAAAAERPRHARPSSCSWTGSRPTSSDLQRDLDARGIALRPHVKTHKSVRISRMQLDAGAAGLTVGTLGEAEVLASAGLRDLFLAYPRVGGGPEGRRGCAPSTSRPTWRSGSIRPPRPSAWRPRSPGPASRSGCWSRSTPAVTGPASRRPGRRSRSRRRPRAPGSRSRACSRTAGTATGPRPPVRPGSTRWRRSRRRPRPWTGRGSRCGP